MKTLRGVAALLLAIPLLVGGGTASADEGWEILLFNAEIAVQADGSLSITESIDVDFGTLEKHGIFREIPVRYRYSETKDRVYELIVTGVRDASGRPPYAIVFGIVDHWAKAFEGLDREATRAMQGLGWYVGQGTFSASAFSSDLSTFSSTVSSTLAYTPGSSGSSGFSSGGGFSGGGGGGGGGGSW